jgi:prophage antirepressor-like protein
MKYSEIVRQFQNNVFGKLTTIKSFQEKGKIWFVGKEIQELLGFVNLTQVIKDAKLKPQEIFILKKISDPNFFNELTTQHVIGYGKRSVSITLISESGLYKLILRSNKPKAVIFTDWLMSDVLPTLRVGVEGGINFNYVSDEVTKHLNISHQKYESKRINKIKINTVGVSGAIDYNIKNCVDHSNITPTQLKRWAKKQGIPASKRTSGKEVLRIVDMPTASAMSLNDNLVANGVPYDKALKLSNGPGKELFKQMIEEGIKPKELEQ